ncbi:hypothetical protein [Nodosilinea sp. E11]|uniref:hypothetical protein n=1 Tax=Nodosilinea sp. E11 TaxID=3037479 RepID=UPI002934E867|nr:hypothetical protein [Nodosilinea sp. E11]WOD40443.1 hypothetical protein RRF56_06510 [Nodosilinea sp. E11]
MTQAQAAVRFRLGPWVIVYRLGTGLGRDRRVEPKEVKTLDGLFSVALRGLSDDFICQR